MIAIIKATIGFCFEQPLVAFCLKNILRHPLKKTFSKVEKLCSKKTIDALFDRNNSANNGLLVYPIRVVYQNAALPITDDTALPKITPQVLFSVSKRNFKKAVDRNLIKRRMRESYRIHKTLTNTPITVAFIYVAKEPLAYITIEKSMQKILSKIM